VNYPDYYNLNKILGRHWMKAGGLQSGYEIFAKLGMWEECIECIVGMGDFTRAVQEIKRFPSPTPTMLCTLGEITADL
jgi:hypothetical protein